MPLLRRNSSFLCCWVWDRLSKQSMAETMICHIMMRLDYKKITVTIWPGLPCFQITCSVGSRSFAISSLRQAMGSITEWKTSLWPTASKASKPVNNHVKEFGIVFLLSWALKWDCSSSYFMKDLEVKSPTYAIPAFLIHRPCEKMNVVFKLLCFLVICYTALEI